MHEIQRKLLFLIKAGSSEKVSNKMLIQRGIFGFVVSLETCSAKLSCTTGVCSYCACIHQARTVRPAVQQCVYNSKYSHWGY